NSIRYSSHGSWQQALDVDRLGFILRSALGLARNGQARNAVEVVVGILAGARDHQVFLLVHQVLALELGQLEVGRRLDRRGGAGLLTQAAEDAAREVDTEELRIPATILGLG